MRHFIIADNQELTGFALQSILKKDEGNAVYRAFDRSGLVALLKEHENAVVLLDYNTNPDVSNTKSALSHASLIKAYIEGNYPE